METQIGIAAAAVTHPATRRDTCSLFQEEAATLPLGISRVGLEYVQQAPRAASDSRLKNTLPAYAGEHQ
jgi:hypothetical protein